MVASFSESFQNGEPHLHVGGPVWSHPQWAGTYAPKRSKRSEDLEWYASWCNAVEGNTTFYANPTGDTLRSWSEQVDDDFRFCFKLPRSITHERRLRNVESELNSFLDLLQPVSHKLGPIWIQLPPSFGPEDLPTLERFLQNVSQEFNWSVELRHPDFEAEGSAERQANDLLCQANVDRTIFDSRALFAGPCITDEERDAWEKKPRLRVRPVAVGDYPTVRFIGQSNADANPAFWQPWVQKVSQWVDEGRTPFVFIHTPDNVEAPSLARQFHTEVCEYNQNIGSGKLKELSKPRPLPDQGALF